MVRSYIWHNNQHFLRSDKTSSLQLFRGSVFYSRIIHKNNVLQKNQVGFLENVDINDIPIILHYYYYYYYSSYYYYYG